jgi:hypothetical protein
MNSYQDASYVYRSIQNGVGSRLEMDYTGNSLVFYNAPTVTADGAQTFTARLNIGQTGTTTLASDSGVNTLVTNGNVGVGVTPSTWGSAFKVLQMGQQGAIWADSSSTYMRITSNLYHDGTTQRAIVAGATALIQAGNGVVQLYTGSSVGAGASAPATLRLGVSNNGQVALTPDTGVSALSIGGTAQPKITVASTAPSSPMTGDLWMW